MIKTKNTMRASALSALVCSFGLHAGTMGDANMGESGKFLLIEGGFSYLNAFYKTNVKGAQSYTIATPNGYSYNPSVVLPNNFSGGYMGLSLFMKSLLINTRYDMYAMKGKNSHNGKLYSRMAPSKLAFTLDKTWGSTQKLIYGLGAGVVLSTHNEAELFNHNPLTQYNGQIGFAYPGRARLDPLVEAVAMYNLSHNFNLRANVSYQIPEHSFYTNGHVDVNLGVNYALPL